ncbi:prepilin-type N-terminal cleavage/methylation domain-containing protein [Marinospirillum minutulum]|uniref:prepilin-type N-terminal cleavage/methylation domain-containing protein n=1 Tax=Marinospirillum minutulum TaxID=64974 RepID=UPI000421E4C9|nr:prepilin-type N-terminal cleavage/methylation domain-containing protein [Marinospirillum minutulum]
MKIKNTQQLGFNLLEVLLALLVVSFLMGFAVPSYQHLLEKQSQTAELARLQAVLNHARLMANLKNETLKICNTKDSKTCSSSRVSLGDLLIVVDKTQEPVHFSPGTGYPIVLPNHSLRIHPLPTQQSGGTLLACTGFSKIRSKPIVLSPTGRVRVSDKDDTDLADKCPN